MIRVLVALATVLSLAVPAHAAEERVTLNAPVPCGLACPYYTMDDQAACAREPLTVPGSWDEVRIVAPELPEGKRWLLLEAGLQPQIDYDGFFCHVIDPGLPSERYEFAGNMANLLSSCAGDPLPIGCTESGMIQVAPGGTYVIRAYNWSDAFACPAWYRFISG